VLTWLGAGDVVEAGVSGGNYGYRLMWVVVVALVMRFLFVSLIAKYQLCNQHGEGVLDGLHRLHRAYAPGLLIACAVMGHVYGSYMAVGVGETWARMTGVGSTWMWAVAWTAVALVIAFRPVYRAMERVFKLLLALLSVSFIGGAIWVGARPLDILRGTFTFSLPAQVGPFDSLLLVVGTIGAVGGSLMNLAYPYFLEQKGWRGPPSWAGPRAGPSTTWRTSPACWATCWGAGGRCCSTWGCSRPSTRPSSGTRSGWGPSGRTPTPAGARAPACRCPMSSATSSVRRSTASWCCGC
jgi:hypothetical protein